MKKRTQASILREQLSKEGVIISPLVYDAISAKVAKAAGFQVLGTSGFSMHAAMLGTPDNGQLAFNEMVEALGKIVDAVELPIIAEAEAGYGNAINTIRTIRCFEKAGIAGVFIEDQQMPPNCPHVKETKVISTEEMCGKIRAAVDAREDPDFLIIARSDAPFADAVERAKAYMEAGADMIKIDPKTRWELEELPKRVDAKLHISFDCSEITKGMTAYDAGEIGYKIVTYPTAPLLSSLYGMMMNMKKLYETGTDWGFVDNMMPFDEFLKFIGKEEYIELERKYLRE